MSDNYNNSLGNKAANAADRALGSHNAPSTTGDVVGETTGGLAGAATGAALGSLGGPIGTIIGGIAGAAGGWWTGRAVSEAASTFDNDDSYYQNQYSSRAGSNMSGSTGSGMSGSTSGSSMSAASYDNARPAYQLGHVAGMNPDYTGRDFKDVEPHLRTGWEAQGNTTNKWDDVRDYARDAYARGQERRLTLSEEQLAVGKREVQAGEVNLRKTVETQHVQQQVGLNREEVSIERRPLTAADAQNLTIGAETIRVPLTREEAVVEKRVVGTEEVVVRTRDVTENQTVEADLRKERLVTEGLDQTTGRAAGTTGAMGTTAGESLVDKTKDVARNVKDDITGKR